MRIDIGLTFSKMPYGRHKCDSHDSGEAFRDTFLIPAIHANDDSTLVVDFSNCTCLPGASWIHEVFNGLSSSHKIYLRQHLIIYTEYQFIRYTVERYLGIKLKKHKEMDDLEKYHNLSWYRKLIYDHENNNKH